MGRLHFTWQRGKLLTRTYTRDEYTQTKESQILQMKTVCMIGWWNRGIGLNYSSLGIDCMSALRLWDRPRPKCVNYKDWLLLENFVHLWWKVLIDFIRLNDYGRMATAVPLIFSSVTTYNYGLFYCSLIKVRTCLCKIIYTCLASTG